MDRSYSDSILKDLCSLLKHYAEAQSCAEANENHAKVLLYDKRIEAVKKVMIGVINEY